MTVTYSNSDQGRFSEFNLLIPPLVLEPAAGWNGTAGTGFTLANPAPTDPTRTTAKPIVRPLDPPNQYFTDTLMYSVMAFANNLGTLNGGIEKVRFHFEGNIADVPFENMRQFTRYDDSNYVLPCYSVVLKKPAGAAGIANLYVEVFPADPAMQRRVLGPIQFSPVATRHDWDRTVGATGSGADYTNASLTTALTNAIAAAKTASAQNPRIRFITSGTYDLAHGTPNYTPQGYLTFECATGVSVEFSKASYTTDTAMLMRTRWDGLWFKGRGFTFQFAFVDRILHEAQSVGGQKFSGRSHVFEGVRFTRSTAVGSLIRKSLPGGTAPFSVTGSPWVLECQIEKMQQVAEIPSLLRGCIMQNGYLDVSFGGAAGVGCYVNGWNGSAYRAQVPAMTVTYTGAGATADLSLSGISAANNRVLTARVNGASVGTFTILNTEAAFTAGTQYNVSNVVNWINSLGAGWSATLQDDTRLAASLTNGVAGFGAFTNVNVRATTLQLFTAFDLHTDFYQKDSANLVENVLIYGNSGIEIDAQLIMIGANASRDWVILNNALGIDDESDDNPGGAVLASQFSHPQSHVVFAHNSFPEQRVALRTGASALQQFNPDAYCLFANNALRDISWDAGVSDADLVLKNNHLHAGATGTGSTGEVKSGNQATMFANYVTGDFTPAGTLATNLREPVWRRDLNGARRFAPAPPGALL